MFFGFDGAPPCGRREEDAYKDLESLSQKTVPPLLLLRADDTRLPQASPIDLPMALDSSSA